MHANTRTVSHVCLCHAALRMSQREATVVNVTSKTIDHITMLNTKPRAMYVTLYAFCCAVIRIITVSQKTQIAKILTSIISASWARRVATTG